MKKRRAINLPAPYLKRVWLDKALVTDANQYPFCLPLFRTDFALVFERFFKAESFFSVARYLDRAAIDANEAPPDFLSHSHGEGFLRFFEERCDRQGIFIFDEPESALSPSRQIMFLKLLARMDRSQQSQVIMATHAPLLMAYPGAQLLLLSKGGLEPITLAQTEHFKLTRAFCADPAAFIGEVLVGEG
jgi:predicted ATPase